MRFVTLPFRIIGFVVFYCKELVIANWRITRDVLTPGLRMNPGFIKVPLRTKTDLELLALANLTTMTPGTLSVDVSNDRKFLFVHALYLDDVEKVRTAISDHLQGKVLELTR